MSVTTPTPIEDAEQQILDAVPAGTRPTVQKALNDLNKTYADAAARRVEAEREAAAKDPGLDALATDVRTAGTGGVIDISKFVGDAQVVRKEVKAGYKTTEFWVTAAVIVLAQVGALKLPGKYGDTITTTAAAASYVVSRGLAK